MIQPKNKVYSGIFFISLGKLTIAIIVFKDNSEIGRILVVYYTICMDKSNMSVSGRCAVNRVYWLIFRQFMIMI